MSVSLMPKRSSSSTGNAPGASHIELELVCGFDSLDHAMAIKTKKKNLRSLRPNRHLRRRTFGCQSHRSPRQTRGQKAGNKKKSASKSSAASSALPAPPTESALNSLSQYPPLSSADTSKMLHVPASFADVARQVIAIWQSLGGQLSFPGLSLDVLIEALATFDAVAPIAAQIEPFYQRATSTRIKASADAAGMMFTLARAVKGVGDTGMAQRFAVLLDWIAKNHPGNKTPRKKPAKTGEANRGGDRKCPN